MKFRNTLILLGVVLVLFIFVYVFEIRKPEESTGRRGQNLGKMLLVEKEDVNKVELVYADPNYEKVICYKDDNGQWQIERPLKAKADQKVMDRLISDAVSKNVHRTYKALEGLAEYGLDNPRVAATFYLRDGTFRTLMLGNTVTTGNRVYVKQKSIPDISEVPARIVDDLSKGAFDLRDKQVMKFERNDVKRIQVKRKDKSIVCIKQEHDWRIVEPVKEKAKNYEVNDILYKLDDLKAEKFVAEKAARLSEYGLDQPDVEVTATFKDGNTETLLVGKKLPDSDSAYAKVAAGDVIFVIKKGVVDELKKDVDKIRE